MTNRYNPERIKELAEENKELSAGVSFACNKIKGRLADSSGRVKKGVDGIIDGTNGLVKESREFLEISAAFFSNMAEELQQMDDTMARKIEES